MTTAEVGVSERRAPRNRSPGRWRGLIGVASALVVLDQAVKWTVAMTIRQGDAVLVTTWLDLVHVLNPGAAFSFFADAGGWQRQALTFVGLTVSAAVAVTLRRGDAGRLETAAYVALIGGALGNVVDRLRIGAVVDYLDLHWLGIHWPAFNLADILIVGSAALLVASSFRLGGAR